ncbi:MAG: caspase family protein [Treponema sp.]|jgi:WD40 repeat protein/uncharacterized caspase-like protein|nr:caspase family protein [Treponema sp.]
MKRVVLLLAAALAVAGSNIAGQDSTDKRGLAVEAAGDIAVFPQLGHVSGIKSAVFSPDGKTIVSGGADHAVKLWDIATSRELFTARHSNSVKSVAFSPDGKTILSASADYSLKLWDAATGREIRTFSGRSFYDKSSTTGHSNNVNSAAFSPDGKTIVSGSGSDYEVHGEFSRDNTLRLWNAATGQELRVLSGHSSFVLSVAFSPDGRTIVSGSADKTVKLWDAATGREIRTFSGGLDHVYSVAFSPDGKTIASGSFGPPKLWDAASGKEIPLSRENYFGAVHSVAFSPDGKTILAGCWDDTLKLWDLASGRLVRTFTGHLESVDSAAFSPDGKRIVSGSSDGTVRLWNVATGKEIVQFVSFTGTDSAIASATRGLTVETEAAASSINSEWLAITPDGYYQASPRGDRYINVRVNNTVTGIDAYSDVLYNPDLVQARLRGLPDPASKAQVTIQQAAQFKPPTVRIQSPDNGITVTGDGTVELSVSVSDQNQPIKDIRILVNGIRIGSGELRAFTGTKGIVVEEGGLRVTGNQKTVNFTVPIGLVESGANTIEVMAYNGFSWGESRNTKAVSVTWQPPAGREPSLPDLWMVAVGVNRYENAGTPALKLGKGSLGNLNYCARDARELAASFKAQEGKRYARVHSLLIADEEGKPPTAANIREGLKFLEQAGQRDVVLLFLAGHGLSEGGRFYFLARDARIENGTTVNPERAISNETLYSVLDGPGRRLIFIDACQSGGMDIDRFMFSLRRSNAFMLSSSEGSKPSHEDNPNNIRWDQHGVFTYSLIRGLGGRAAPAAGANIGVTQLSGYVINEVLELTRQFQSPQKPVQYSGAFSDFDIALTK